MRRTTMIESVGNVLEALETSGVSGILGGIQPGSGNRKRPSAAETIRRFHEFAAIAGNFDDDQLEVLSAFDLDTLLDTNTWLAFAVETEGGGSQGLQRSLNYKYRTFRAYAPKMISMVENDGLRLRREPPAGGETITLILPGNEGEFSSAERVSNALEGVQKIYSVCAQLVNEDDQDLRIVACDSGQDLAFDLLGARLVMDHLQEVLDSIWDRVVFHRSLPADARNKAVVETLPILDTITKATKGSGGVKREQAELMRRGVKFGATAFLESGCLTESFEQPLHLGARQLLAPNTKMISGPVDGQDPSPELTQPLPVATQSTANPEATSKG